jgi:hydroxyacylglutathione hydrolase
VILETIPVGPLSVNCYLFGDHDARRAIVIDPGDETERVLEAIEALGCHLEAIVATHGHFDHVSGIAAVKRAYPDVPLLAHRDDLFLLESNADRAGRWGFEVEDCPPANRYLADGDTVRVGAFELRVIHTPGHSPGGICLAGEGLVFAGDTLFQGTVGRTDVPGGDQAQLVRSIRERLYVLPCATRVFPGHGPATTIGDEKRTNAVVRA